MPRSVPSPKLTWVFEPAGSWGDGTRTPSNRLEAAVEESAQRAKSRESRTPRTAAEASGLGQPTQGNRIARGGVRPSGSIQLVDGSPCPQGAARKVNGANDGKLREVSSRSPQVYAISSSANSTCAGLAPDRRSRRCPVVSFDPHQYTSDLVRSCFYGVTFTLT